MSQQINRSTYTLVTMAYWAFMLTDGALRMVVLLKFHQMGFSPIKLAFLFLLYEIAGIITNLIGGWIGARFGLRKTLFLGLTIQILALLILSVMPLTWAPLITILYVMIVQALSGIAKDLTKMSSKSSIKLLLPEKQENSEYRLFLWVAILTGLKNALKGVGFFIGGLLLSLLGYEQALQALAGILIITFIVCLLKVRQEFGKSKVRPKFTQIFSKSNAINTLSLARAFLFAARDVWFVVAVPIFLHQELDWTFSEVGGFMAAWVIGYGFIQAGAPKITRATSGLGSAVVATRTWGIILALACASIPFCLDLFSSPGITLLVCLSVFGFVFAINSSLHSYLILAYTTEDKVSLNVGFYYMANASGRLMGTLLSGIMYVAGGIHACLWTALAMCSVSALLSFRFPKQINLK